MRCLKAFGDRIAARDPDRQTAEIQMPQARVAQQCPLPHTTTIFLDSHAMLRDTNPGSQIADPLPD
jgi:hypothetical protein